LYGVHIKPQESHTFMVYPAYALSVMDVPTYERREMTYKDEQLAEAEAVAGEE